MVEVKQSARDAAARIWRAQGNGFVADAIERGEHDHWPVVQEVAAAEHRGRIAGMREAAGIARSCMKLISIGEPGTGPFTRDDQVVDEVTGIIEEAIRQRATAIETGADHDR